jgi:putative cardiolipin synthase
MRLLVAASAASAACLLAGCAALPARVDRPASSAVPPVEDGALGRAALAGRPAASPELSGFRFLPTGNYAFNARIELARRAEKSLDVQYYLLQNDAIGLRLLRELRDAAARGVRVRVLVDDLYTGGREPLFAGLAAHAKVEVRLFNPLPVRDAPLVWRFLLSSLEFERINHRMHNKLFVADNVLAVTGGRNVADEYFMKSAAANFIDMDVIASGPVVQALSGVFDEYWNSVHVFPVASLLRPFDAAEARRRFDALVAGADPALPAYERDPLGATPVEQQLAAGRLEQTWARATVFADSPSKVTAGRDAGVSHMMRSTLAVIGAARSEVIIVSPYFIPGRVGMPMMETAQRNGVRVVLFTNGLDATDEPLVHWNYARYRRQMLKLGVRIYEFSGTRGRASLVFGDFGSSLARLHAKIALVDGRRLYIGSMNLDGRSAVATTELGLVIDSETLGAELRRLMTRDDYGSMLRVRLAANGEDVEWVADEGKPTQTVFSEEPGDGWWHRVKLWLTAPFASEELL